MCSYPCGCFFKTSPFIYVLTISPDQDVCLFLGSHVIREISNILCTVDIVESCTCGSKFNRGLSKGVSNSIFSERTGYTDHGIDV